MVFLSIYSILSTRKYDRTLPGKTINRQYVLLVVMVRPPSVAGQFYEGGAERLREQIRECFNSRFGPGSLPGKASDRVVLGAISPHAGFMFSGAGAAHVYREIAESVKPDLFIIAGPNHTGMGQTSVLLDDFITPLGTCKVDKEFGEQLIENTGIEDDPRAHVYEHSLEVQLPFLQFIYDDFKFLPIVVSSPLYLEDLSKGLSRTIMESGKRVCFIVSSDFTHFGSNYGYVPFTEDAPVKVKKQDMEAIELIKKGDDAAFMKFIQETGATICGFMPILLFLKTIKFQKAELLSYYTSGDVLGDHKNSVSYASIVFK